MLLLASYDVVFQEIPGEVTLVLNIAGCPNRCEGCHSPHLREMTGEPLDEALLSGLLERYASAVTCVGFMGGDGAPAEVSALAAMVKAWSGMKGPDRTGVPALKTAWYSGQEDVPETVMLTNFDFIKLGPYIERFGGLPSPDTNQRFYRIEGGKMVDETAIFRKKPQS